MKVVTTPMCQEVLELAGVSEFTVTRNFDYKDADIAVVLSETELDENNQTRFIKIKLNTFYQINESIKTISILGTEIRDQKIRDKKNINQEIKDQKNSDQHILGQKSSDQEINDQESISQEIRDYNLEKVNYFKIRRNNNRKIKVKVYSNFLKDIVEDMGFTVVSQNGDFLVYPDYLKTEIMDEITLMKNRAFEIPSHKNAPKNPLKRADMRYKILEKSLCTKL